MLIGTSIFLMREWREVIKGLRLVQKFQNLSYKILGFGWLLARGLGEAEGPSGHFYGPASGDIHDTPLGAQIHSPDLNSSAPPAHMQCSSIQWGAKPYLSPSQAQWGVG